MTEKYPRGVCCHEAGHAVVAWSFKLPVVAVYVACSEAKGWYGGANVPAGSDAHLHFMDQVVILAAGKTGEKVLACPAHEPAWLDDLWKMHERLNANGISQEKERWSRITEACERARLILETHRDKALKLVDQLVECGRVERPEFLRLMNGETSQSPNS